MPGIVTFNIRYPEPSDGLHVWENRRRVFVTALRSANPDVAGLQEPVIEQIEYIAESAPEYGWLGVSRYGNRFEKFTPLFYRRDSVTPVEWGSFWLSDTPEVVGSGYPEMAKPRVVTWAVFENNCGQRFACFNAHLQYQQAEYPAKLRSAVLIRDRVASFDGPAILTGDFNHPAGGAVHAILTSTLKDAWTEADVREGPEGTFHGFTGQPRTSRRIDWLLFRGPLRVTSCRTLTGGEDGIYPSDHFAVAADFEFASAAEGAAK